jgi:hypothetical protein
MPLPPNNWKASRLAGGGEGEQVAGILKRPARLIRRDVADTKHVEQFVVVKSSNKNSLAPNAPKCIIEFP